MSTSGSTNFSQTRDNIISRALRIIGAIGQGETPNTNELSEASTALNVIIKSLAADGMPLWAITEYTVSPIAGTASYTIPTAAPLKVYDAWYRNTTTNEDTPLMMITQSEYNRLNNKTTQGTPSQFFYSTPGWDGTGTLYLYLTPDTTFTTDKIIHFYGQRMFQDMDSASDDLDFPIHWANAITWLLASELAFEYGVGLSERGMISKKAQEAKQQVLGFSTEEGSLLLQPYPNWND